MWDLTSYVAVSTAFITITISTPDRLSPSPGNYDPEIPETLAWYTQREADATADQERRSLLQYRASNLLLRSQQMKPRGQRLNWWRDLSDQIGGRRNNTNSDGGGHETTRIALPRHASNASAI